MFRNNFKLAIRNFLKFKLYSAINLIGMSIGIAAGVLILLFINDELSFDKFHEKGDRIYKLVTASEGGGMETNAWPVGHKLKTEFPEIEDVIYTKKAPSRFMVNYEGNRYKHDVFYGSESFFKVFTFNFIEGNPALSLIDPYTIVITKEIKDRYFNSELVLGKTITLQDSLDFTITGVIEDIPSQSHIQFDMLVSFTTYTSLDTRFSYSEGWGNFDMRNYILTKPDADISLTKTKAASLYRDNIGEFMDQMGVDFSTDLIPLKDIYLYSNYYNGFGPKGSIKQVKLVGLIGAFIILLACINFINITTARSIYRAREVGIRKLSGSGKATIFWQFIFESVVLSFSAFLLSILLIELTLPFFNHLMAKQYTLSSLISWQVMLSTILLVLLMGLVSGYYPARILSGLKSQEAISGKMQNSSRGVKLRRILVITQFSLSASLVLGTILVMQQLNYMRDQNLGFAKDQILVANATNVPGKTNSRVFAESLKNITGVESITFTNALPGRPGWQGQWAFPDKFVEDNHVDTEYMAVDEHYVATLGLSIIAGRNFDINRVSDLEEGLIINETTVKEMGWKSPEDAIGRMIVSPSKLPEGTVIGVVKDYHGQGLQHEIWPKVMDYSSKRYGRYYAIRFETGATTQVLDNVRVAWNNVYGDYDFDYFFLDQEFDKQYKAEDRLMNVFTLFAVLGTIIACIGLLGMVAFMVNTRIKEICIRKLHGANISNVTLLLSKEFIVLVLIANILVIAPVWYYGNLWMADFAYHTQISPVIFLINLVLMTLLALVTVSYQTIKAAFVNPAEMLRNE